MNALAIREREMEESGEGLKVEFGGKALIYEGAAKETWPWRLQGVSVGSHVMTEAETD